MGTLRKDGSFQNFIPKVCSVRFPIDIKPNFTSQLNEINLRSQTEIKALVRWNCFRLIPAGDLSQIDVVFNHNLTPIWTINIQPCVFNRTPAFVGRLIGARSKFIAVTRNGAKFMPFVEGPF